MAAPTTQWDKSRRFPTGMQGMVFGMVVDSNVLSYPVLVSMKVQGAVIGRGGASPQTLGEAKLAPGRRARWS